jgi:AcrR family transcriptional regulator
MSNSDSNPALLTQEKKMSRTGLALVRAAKRLISEGRLDISTIDDITREAGVSKRSFHNHFRDRDALLDHIVIELRAELSAAVAAVNMDVHDPVIRLARGFFVSMQQGARHGFSERIFLHASANAADPASPGNQRLVHDLKSAILQEQVELRQVDAGIVLVLGLSDLAVSRLFRMQDERTRAERLMHNSCVMMLRGLGVDEHRVNCLVEDAMRIVIDSNALFTDKAEG